MEARVAVLAVFKNEADILDEWLQHYLREGVGRFYLIDNDSDDNVRAVLSGYDPDVVQWYTDARRHAQVSIYNDALESRIKPDPWNPEWILVCDLDEFVYAPPRNDTIAAYLSRLPSNVTEVRVRWLMFGSSGHKEQPAEGVVAGFRWRARYPLHHAYTDYWKSIVRTSAIEALHVHEHAMLPGDACPPLLVDTETEETIADAPLRMNHYAVMSYGRFSRIKMVRGDVHTPSNDGFRDDHYFQRYDFKEVLDNDLHE